MNFSRVYDIAILTKMMEQSNSLLLNEEALSLCTDSKKPVFVYEWLRYLNRILPATEKVHCIIVYIYICIFSI